MLGYNWDPQLRASMSPPPSRSWTSEAAVWSQLIPGIADAPRCWTAGSYYWQDAGRVCGANRCDPQLLLRKLTHENHRTIVLFPPPWTRRLTHLPRGGNGGVVEFDSHCRRYFSLPLKFRSRLACSISVMSPMDKQEAEVENVSFKINARWREFGDVRIWMAISCAGVTK